VIELPISRQTFGFDCGAKALQVVMAYYGIDVREDELMKELGCDRQGTPLRNMVSVAAKNGFQVVAEKGVALDTVKQYVDQDHPVIVIVQAWAERYMAFEDWKDSYDNGHYVIVIGYNEKIVIFEDPASFRRTWLKEEEFLIRWHDMDPRTQEKFDHFAMVLLGKQPVSKALKHMD
jgi:predicted double-glycine peptidase